MTATEAAAFDRWHSRCSHDNDDRKREDKAWVAAINHALKALLNSSAAEVDSFAIEEWIRNNLGFGTDYVPLERIEEHLAYEAGKDGFGSKKFKSKRPTIHETRPGIFLLPKGCNEYHFKEISHRRK
jgi:hypothetical protein